MRVFLASLALAWASVASAETYIGADGPTFQVETGVRSAPHAMGLIVPKEWGSKMQRADLLPPMEALPAKFSWADKLTPIRDQGSCGSCWAFSATATISDVLAIHGKGALDLSEQYMVSCDKESSGCGGGWFDSAFELVRMNGEVIESAFPYTASNQRCPASLPHTYKILSWHSLSSGVASVNQIKNAIYTYGPISVAVAVAGKFQNYKSGIYNESASGSVNHAVNLVGWDDTTSPPSWVMRNSWGPSWGEKGYMRIAYGSRKIGYAASYVDFAGPVPHVNPTPGPSPTPPTPPSPDPNPCECTFWGWLATVFKI
jgi:C1A family cysteine protease